MEITPDQAARNRHAAAVRALGIEVRKGDKYRGAVRALEQAERRKECPAALAVRRFAVAYFAPLPTDA